ncbi:unnamed protein product [Closterium sp. Naga37s-1]|nr:unnamed protein product [Closterium sp. Naga37s-1]
MALDDVARPLGAERAGDQTVWRDADAALAAACAELQSGELLHGESFSLFEAMAALQMMDPKMDAGMGGAKGGGGGKIGGEGGGAEGARGEVESVGEAMERGLLPLPLPAHRIVDLSRGEVESVGEAVERGLLPLPAHRIVDLSPSRSCPLSAHCIVDLCNALLCAEVCCLQLSCCPAKRCAAGAPPCRLLPRFLLPILATPTATWHSGHSLPQTVFTCAYLLLPPLAAPPACTPSPSPSLSSSPLLLALLSAVLASVNSVRSAACWTHQRERAICRLLDAPTRGESLTALAVCPCVCAAGAAVYRPRQCQQRALRCLLGTPTRVFPQPPFTLALLFLPSQSGACLWRDERNFSHPPLFPL